MDENKVTAIPSLRLVIYDTYANFPTTNLAEGDLAYATDRLVFYRWSGAAWQAVTIHSSSGVAANIPNAADLPNGSLYHETDTNILKMVQASAWVSMPKGVAFTELVGSERHMVTTDSVWEDWDLSAIVPAGTVSVLVDIEYNTVTAYTAGARKNGSALVRNRSHREWASCEILTEVDANRVIECWVATGGIALVKFSILGYWGN